MFGFPVERSYGKYRGTGNVVINVANNVVLVDTFTCSLSASMARK